jgi:cytochrome b
MQQKAYIWSKITRYFHWILVVCIAITFISAEFENGLLWHIAFGSIAGGLLTFRLLWGIVGTKYEKFSHFNFSLSDLFYYLTKLFKDRKTYAGHNPAASWATVLLIIFGFFCTLSGVLLVGSEEDRGLFSFLDVAYYEDILKMHIISKNVVGIVALIHIVGAFLEHFWHKTKIINTMVDGYKNVNEEDIKTSKLQKFFGVFAIAFSIFIGFFTLFLPEYSIMTKNTHEVFYHKDNPLFAKQCSECHNLYPPLLLSKASWSVVLEDPKQHFRETLNVKVPDFESIKKYILTNSAETHSNEISRNIMQSTKGKNIYRITRTRYWKDVHAFIPREAYKHPKIKTKSNCSACHKNFGLSNYINDEDISLEYFTPFEALKIYLHIKTD